MSNLDKIVFLTFLLNPILITPFWNLDSINVPRFALIMMFSSIAIYFLFDLDYFSKINRVLINIFYGFILLGICIVLSTETPIWKQLFGEQGRNTGFLSYLGLMSLLIASSQAKSLTESRFLGSSLYFGGFVNMSYGILQVLKKDPVNWQNPYGPVVGMLGNPNFMSSFMGFFSVYLSWKLIFPEKKSISSFLLTATTILLTLFTIYKTQSIQGFFVFLAGLILLLFFKFQVYRKARSFWIFSALILLLGIVLIFGFLGQGPLGSLIMQSTFKVRLFFWQAAISMFVDKPIFGHGFDSFGDLYREYRPTQIVSIYGPDLLVNAAHNVFLDMAVSGGIFLLGIFVFLYLYVLFTSIKYIRSVESLSNVFILLFSLWVAYLLQSLISINQLSISIFGFIVSGLLIASTKLSPNGQKVSKLNKGSGLGAQACGIILIVTSTLIIRPLLINDHDFRMALSQNNGQVMLNVVQRWPQNDFYLVVISRLFYNNNYKERGRDLAYVALKINPRNFSALELIYSDTEISDAERARIKGVMQELDPQNPRLKD